jgi:hypothetical protein
MVRDPRDVIVSRHGKQTGGYFEATSLITFRQRWRIAKRLTSHPRFMLIRYEDLIATPDAVQDQLAQRLPFLQRTHAFSEFHQMGPVSAASQKALNGVRPIDPSNRGKWKDHIDRLREKLEESGPIDQELIELGYETDPHWMQHAGLTLKAGTSSLAIPAHLRPKFKERVRTIGSAMISALCSKTGIPIG